MPNFKIVSKDGNARVGVLGTAHGEVKTPVFMPVGTQGTVKTLSPDDLKAAGAQIILGNTYHLYLRPGSKLIKKMGGLHKFMGWDRPILTDSGGFQAFSLGAMIEHGVKKVPGRVKQFEEAGHKIYKSQRVFQEKYKTIIRHVTAVVDPKASPTLSKITDNGVEFKSHLDGSKHLLTPEKSIQVQLDLGSDIVLVLDELLSPLHNKIYVQKSLQRTHDWEQRSKKYFQENLKKSINPGAQLFGIIQGVYDKSIREGEAEWAAGQDFSGFAIGGSFGTSKYWPASTEVFGPEASDRRAAAGKGVDSSFEHSDADWAVSSAIYKTLEWVIPFLPEQKPRHILGIGEVQDFFECVERGADMFDCVAPTRRARNGSLYISPKNDGTRLNKFTLSISRAEFATDQKAIDPGCSCYTCQNFSRAYLRHLYLSGEMLYHRLATIHNVYFMLHLVDQIRESIAEKQFKKLKKQWLKS